MSCSALAFPISSLLEFLFPPPLTIMISSRLLLYMDFFVGHGWFIWCVLFRVTKRWCNALWIAHACSVMSTWTTYRNIHTHIHTYIHRYSKFAICFSWTQGLLRLAFLSMMEIYTYRHITRCEANLCHCLLSWLQFHRSMVFLICWPTICSGQPSGQPSLELRLAQQQALHDTNYYWAP